MERRITFSSTIRLKYKQNTKVTPIVVNRLYSFPSRYTWSEVVHELTTDNEKDSFHIDKLDEVCITVSDKVSNGIQFEPDLEEEIRVVHDFDKRLKYVIFDIMRDWPSTFDKSGDENNNTTNAFDIMMKNRRENVKFASKLDENAPRFNGKFSVNKRKNVKFITPPQIKNVRSCSTCSGVSIILFRKVILMIIN
jgi:hypothetical protein